jgi:primosomal protein N''
MTNKKMTKADFQKRLAALCQEMMLSQSSVTIEDLRVMEITEADDQLTMRELHRLEKIEEKATDIKDFIGETLETVRELYY